MASESFIHALLLFPKSNISFVGILREQAATCEFGIKEDDYIRDQLIGKLFQTKDSRAYLLAYFVQNLARGWDVGTSLEGYDLKVGKTNALSHLNSLDQVHHGVEYDFVRAIV